MSASVNLVCVPPQLAREIWPLVSDRLHQAVLRTDMSHTADLEYDVLEGDGLLWLATNGTAIEAAAATLLIKTDRNLVCVITALGGENRSRWLDLLAGIELWAKAEGAAKMRIYGRRGWTRVLKDYRVSNVVMEKSLG